MFQHVMNSNQGKYLSTSKDVTYSYHITEKQYHGKLDI